MGSRLATLALALALLGSAGTSVSAGGFRVPSLPRIERRVGKRPAAALVPSIAEVASEHHLRTFVARGEEGPVLHVVVPRTRDGRRAYDALRRTVADRTVELRYRLPTEANPRGHVALRAGASPVVDLVGATGSTKPLARLARAILGKVPQVWAVRRRSSREIVRGLSRAETLGYLFPATRDEISDVHRTLEARRRSIRGFAIDGGDPGACTYNCAQFVTHGMPFLNERGVDGARAALVGQQAGRSPALAAVFEYGPEVGR